MGNGQKTISVKAINGSEVKISSHLAMATMFIPFGSNMLLCMYPDVPAISVTVLNEHGVYEHVGDMGTHKMNGKPVLAIHSIAMERIMLNGESTTVHNPTGAISDISVQFALTQKERWLEFQTND